MVGWDGWMGWDKDAICPWVCARTDLCRWGNLETPTDRTSKQHFFFFPLTLRLLLVEIQSSLCRVSKQAGKAKQAIKEMMMMDNG